MEENRKNIPWLLFCVYLTILVCHARGQADETEVCDSVAVMTVSEGPHGVTFSATPVVTDAVERDVVADAAELLRTTLPRAECGPGYERCPLVCIDKADSLLCTYPVRNGTDNFLALANFEWVSNKIGYRVKKILLVPPTAPDCIPLAVFHGGPEAPVENLVPCLNITSADNSYLYFERLVLSMASLADSTLLSHTLEYIQIPERNVSPLLYRGGVTTCSPPYNVFMKVGVRVPVYRIFKHTAMFHYSAAEIQDCSGVKNIELFEPDYLRLQCSPTDVVIYDPCSTENIVERRDLTVNATVFQCPDADLNVYHFEGHLKFEAYGSAVPSHPFGGFKLPFNDTTTGRCVGARSPVLLLARGSGETYLLELSSGNLQFVAVDTCGPNVCLDVSVLKTGRSSFAGVFDYSNNTYVVIDLRCPKSPVVSRVYYNTHRPARLALAAIGNTRHCSPCSMSTPPRPETTTTTEDSTSSQDTSVESGGNNLAASNTGALIGAGAGGGVVVVVLAVVMVLLAVIVIVQSRPCEHLRLPSAPSTSGDTELSSLPEHPVAPIPQIPGDVTVNESVRVSSQAVAQEDRRAMVPPADTADRTRFTHTEVHDNYHKRTQNENDSNNFEQKRRAFASAP
jgi:hypothetical protein